MSKFKLCNYNMYTYIYTYTYTHHLIYVLYFFQRVSGNDCRSIDSMNPGSKLRREGGTREGAKRDGFENTLGGPLWETREVLAL